MDISNALIARSDQLNSSDLIGGPQTVTIIEVTKGNTDQPVNVVTDIFGSGRPFKPSKTVLRILAGAWGKETAEWVGRSMTLFRDPSVRWAGEEVGGIRIKALSHIEKAVVFNLPTSKGKHAKSTITPIEVTAPKPSRDWLAELTLAGNDLDAVSALGQAASKAGASMDVLKQIRDQYTALKGAQ